MTEESANREDEDETQRVMLLSPLRGHHTMTSVVITADCGCQAWVSAPGKEALDAGGFRTICTDCIDPKSIDEVDTLPGVRQELTELMGVAATDQALAAVKDPDMRAYVFGLLGSKPVPEKTYWRKS